MEIQVQKGEGITTAIKRTLKEKEGATNNNFKGSVWNKILDLVDQQNEENKAKGEKALYQGGNDRGNDYRNNYKVFVGQILKFSTNIWNQIKAVVGLTGAQPTQPTEPTQPAEPAQPTQPTKPAQPTNPAQKVSADDIKVTVPVPKRTIAKPNKAAVDTIEKNQKEGKEVAAKIKEAIKKCGNLATPGEVDNAENMLKLITKDNIAYVLEAYPNLIEDIDKVDCVGYGFDKDEILKYVLKPLCQQAKEYGYNFKSNHQGNMSSDEFAEWLVKSSMQVIKNTTSQIVNAIVNTDSDRVKRYQENIKIYNEETKAIDEAQKAQECFDKANALLVEVANMNPKPEVKKCDDYAQIKLSDGRIIQVDFDENKNIEKVFISFDTTKAPNGEDLAEVCYKKDKASYRLTPSDEKYDGSIQSGYDFEKIKALVKQIFNINS